ncbi:MAG: hypothetical protein IJH17_01535, partial [Clostridia bacterium]|nr:hypothetical protein [Clostridia bacterium]
MEKYMFTEASFDFGKKPAVDGYTKVTENTLYTPERGYGLIKEAVAEERQEGEKELNRDLLFVDENTFRVDMENGEYIVRVSTGDYDDEGDTVVRYEINGTQGGAWVKCNCVMEKIYTVNVTDGKMEFTFFSSRHTVLNSIDITIKRSIEITGFKADVTAKRDAAAVKLSWDMADGVIGYRVQRINPARNNEVELSADVITEEYVDETVELCQHFIYTVCPLYAQKFCGETSKITVDVVDGGVVTEKINNLDAKETPKSVALVWDKVESAVWYNIYRKAPYGIYKYIAKTTDTDYIDDKVVTNVPYVYGVEAVTTSGKTERADVTIDMEAEPKKRKMETLDRGGVAVPTENGIFLSWRLNAYEYEQGIDFVIYRNGERITDIITDSTNYLDKDGKQTDVYTIKAVKDGKAEKHGYEVKVWDKEYLSIPLDKPAPWTDPNDGTVYQYTAN